MEEFQDNEAKQIINCGHLYHELCIAQCEDRQWNNPNGREWPLCTRYEACSCSDIGTNGCQEYPL